MNPLWWVVWSAICAVGTGLLVYFIMQSHMELVMSRQREELASARASLAAQKEALEGSLKNAEETARSKAMDAFLADIRIEERHYTREHKVLFMSRKMLVRQERIFFRNIPLSNWVENEMPIEEGVDAEKMAQTMSVFLNAAMVSEAPGTAVHKLLR
jgi:hypothetical protein